MHPRVQRLDTAIHHLGKLRHLRHFGDGQPRRLQRLRRAAGGEQLHAVLSQRTRELDEAGLV